MKKSILKSLCALLLLALCIGALFACGDTTPIPEQPGNEQSGGETSG